MDDQSIIRLYFQRDEEAIARTEEKYGPYCYRIAYNILTNREDAEESVSDTYIKAWEAMPPSRPAVLSAFLGKITRRIAIDRWRSQNASKRGGGETVLALEELGECIAGKVNTAQEYERKELLHAYIKFLDALPVSERRVFLCRYWYVESIEDIAEKYGFTRSKVKTMLHRTRNKLRKKLAEEGYL